MQLAAGRDGRRRRTSSRTARRSSRRRKYPREVHVVDAVPLTSVGKLDRKALRQRAGQDPQGRPYSGASTTLDAGGGSRSTGAP